MLSGAYCKNLGISRVADTSVSAWAESRGSNRLKWKPQGVRPLPAGKTVVIKLIDPRGNEVMKVHKRKVNGDQNL